MMTFNDLAKESYRYDDILKADVEALEAALEELTRACELVDEGRYLKALNNSKNLLKTRLNYEQSV